MKKYILLLTAIITLSACNDIKPSSVIQTPMPMDKYPCGMSFAHYSKLPPQKDGNTDTFIVHFISETDYTIIYSCHKGGAALYQDQIDDPDFQPYKRIIDGRQCFKSDWRRGADRTAQITCVNQDDLEILQIFTNTDSDADAANKLADEILSTVSFK